MKTTALLALALSSASALAQTSVSDYDNMAEGFLGGTFVYNGVTYRDCNNVGGVFPDGSAFTADDIGFNFIIENSTFLYNDFPQYGSPVNSLTFGTAFVPGENLSIGAFAQMWLDLPQVANAVSFDMAFYENGPWGGIQFRLEVVRNNVVVGSDSVTISDLGGRDNPTVDSMSVAGVEFDTVHVYATFNGQFSAPRLLIDDLALTYASSCGSADFDGDGDTGTDADIEAFFACLGGSCCATCGTADFDGDGDTGTDADIEAFFRVLGGGSC